MNPAEIANCLQVRFPQALTAVLPEDKHPRVHTTAEHWRAMAEYLRHDPALQMDWLANLSGVDYVADGQMAVVYDLWSFDLRHSFAVKVYCDRATPVLPSVCDLWPAANWHEREVFDLLGITFANHPDLRRILLPDDWIGHPLRKDYEFPKEYHGIPGNYDTADLVKPPT
jgi:NADH-quinone oxidoreductase subunit C